MRIDTKLLLSLLSSWKIIPLVLLLGCSEPFFSGVTVPISTASIQTRSVRANSLPLHEVWRWSGFSYSTMDPPKIAIQDNYLIIEAGFSKDYVLIFDIQSGQVIWQSNDMSHLQSFAVDDQFVYLGGMRYGEAYDLQTGRKIWRGIRQSKHRKGELYIYHNGVTLEVYHIDLSQTPQNQRLDIVDPVDGKILDTLLIPDLFFQKDNIVYTVPYAGGHITSYLYAQDKETGKPFWELDLKSAPRRWPIMVDRTMYLDAGDIYAIDVDTGDILWQSTAGHRSSPEPVVIGVRPENNFVSRMAYAEGMIYVVRDDAAIVGLDAKTGETVGLIEMTPLPVYHDQDGFFQDTYYVIAASGRYVAVYYFDSQELIVFQRETP